MPTATGVSNDIRSDARSIITDLASTKFRATIGSDPDIVNVFMALIYRESSFNPDPRRTPLGYFGSGSKDFRGSSAYQNIASGTDPVAKQNMEDCNAALGLCQVLGFYFIQNSSAKNGKNELERARPDLSSSLVIPAGSNVISFITGADNIEKAITAGMIILESKYKAATKIGSSWGFTGDKNGHLFSSKLAAAIGAYLGLGTADQYGTTPEAYAASIVGGTSYTLANNPNTVLGTRVAQTGGQVASTDGSGKTKITPIGC